MHLTRASKRTEERKRRRLKRSNRFLSRCFVFRGSTRNLSLKRFQLGSSVKTRKTKANWFREILLKTERFMCGHRTRVEFIVWLVFVAIIWAYIKAASWIVKPKFVACTGELFVVQKNVLINTNCSFTLKISRVFTGSEREEVDSSYPSRDPISHWILAPAIEMCATLKSLKILAEEMYKNMSIKEGNKWMERSMIHEMHVHGLRGSRYLMIMDRWDCVKRRRRSLSKAFKCCCAL